MYPSQTSMIPVQIALVRFLEQGGSIFSHYPYWYLGTTPFRYLTGPILPGLLALLHKVLPQFSLFEIMFGVIGVFWVIGGIGVYKLVVLLANFRENPVCLSSRKNAGLQTAGKPGFLAAFFYLLGPIVPFLFSFSDGLHLVAFSCLPWILWSYSLYLRNIHRPKSSARQPTCAGRPPNLRGWLCQPRRFFLGSLLCLLMAFVILLDTSIIPSMILGMISVLLAVSGWKKIEEKIKSSLLIILCSLFFATIWYSPKYWWQILLAPSFAGKPLISVVGQLGQLLPLALAIVLAIVTSKKIKLSVTSCQLPVAKFSFYYLFIFAFLTLMRFISDPDFWLDWSAYGLEIQMGLGILGAFVIARSPAECGRTKQSKAYMRLLRFARNDRNCDARKVFSFNILLFTLYSLLFTLIFKKHVLDTLQNDITRSVEYKIGQKLSGLVKPGEEVILSGSPVFWLNAFFDISQIRGGIDRVSVNQDWRKAVWEIREGKDPEKSIKWLKDLDISWLVVHTEDSKEFYHDFKYPEKFEEVEELEKVYDKSGDRIYKINF